MSSGAHGAVAETLALAFTADPLMAWIFEEDRARTDQLRTWWTWIVEHLPAHGEVLETSDGLSAAVWYGPDPIDGGGHDGFPEMLADLLGPDVARRKLAGLAVIPAARPQGRYWYLGSVGTRPAAQGRGRGVHVVRPVLDRCDAVGLPAYLESSNPRNLGFYERLGFAAVGTVAIPDGPPMTPMWRDPAP